MGFNGGVEKTYLAYCSVSDEDDLKVKVTVVSHDAEGTKEMQKKSSDFSPLLQPVKPLQEHGK